MLNLGFVGTGNMGGAILQGAVAAGFLTPGNTFAYDKNDTALKGITAKTGAVPCASAAELAQKADMVLLAVKPNILPAVLEELRPVLAGKAVLSIALGWNVEKLLPLLPSGTRAAFVMPNTSCLALQGLALLEEGHTLNEEELAFVQGLFASIGKLETLKSEYMNVGGTLSGCGPAFLYLAMEAMADAAVLNGLPRDTAYRLVGQMAAGAGAMLAQPGAHPGVLKDGICSPGGSTIRGVRALEDTGARAAYIKAVDDAVNFK